MTAAVSSCKSVEHLRVRVTCSGSGLSVVISVKELNVSPLYTTVDHSRGNDNAAFGGDQAVIRDYCPYPLPLAYRLSSVVHQVAAHSS